MLLWILKSSSIYHYVRPALIYTKDRFPTFCPLGIPEALHSIVLSCGHVFWVTLVRNCSCRKELCTPVYFKLNKIFHMENKLNHPIVAHVYCDDKRGGAWIPVFLV